MVVSTPHFSVLRDEVIASFAAVQNGTIVDGTFGAGGYTRALLETYPACRVIAFDRDETILPFVQKIKGEFPDRFTFIPDCFGNMALHLKEPVNGIVLDLGVSSMQIDTPERGFSFRFDGPLDMRMGSASLSAADIVNTFSEKEIADILFKYGEEKASFRIARAIVAARGQGDIRTTLQLAEIIHHVMPKPKDGSDSATRSFQALRIFVNDELGELERTLEASKSLLSIGGVLSVVSFHSLEDRLVKNFFIQNSDNKPNQNRHLPVQNQERPLFKIMTKKPIVAGEKELSLNSRSASAKLRTGVRI